MKSIQFIRYFFYLALNWNFRIARYIIRQEIKGEKKYGINTTGADELKHLEVKGIDIEHATIYMPINYPILEQIFTRIDIGTRNHFLDIGCGKGRALCVAAYYGCKKVTGIDLSKKFVDETIENINAVKQVRPELQYEIKNTDAFYYHIPNDVDCIFLFNPFDAVIMSGVAENIAMTLENNPRKMIIIYANPLFKEELLSIGFIQTFHIKKMEYLEAVILEN
jgi:SAM-dependent methyltransferase